MKKIVAVSLGIAVVIIGGVTLAKNAIATSVITGGVRAMTGLNLSLDRVRVGIITTRIGLEGLKLENPSGYTERIMVDLPEVYIDYDLGAFLQKRVHLEEVRLHLKELVVVKQENGEQNLDSLKALSTTSETPSESQSTAAGDDQPKLQIDSLHLKIEQVRFVDYSGIIKPRETIYPVNIDEHFENITDPKQLAAVIVSRALMNTALSRVVNFDLIDTGAFAVNVVGGAAAAAADVATGAIGSAADVGGKAVNSTKEAVKSTTDNIKKLLPFAKD